MKTCNLQHFPPRKQQGYADTCQANALAAIFETFRRRAGHPGDDLSRMFLHAEGERVQGLPPPVTPAVASIVKAAQTVGVAPEYLHPYGAGDNYQTPSQHAYAVAATQRAGAHYSAPVDVFNYTANANTVRTALEQGWLVGLAFKQRRWFTDLMNYTEDQHLAIAAAVVPGSYEDGHTFNHFIAVADFDDNYNGQGLAFLLVDSFGDKGGRSVQVVGPSFFRDTINIEVFRGFADCNDAHTYDADGLPGQVYRLYQAAFNRVPDKGGLGFQIHAVTHGLPMWQLAQNFMASPEGQQKLPSTLTDRQFVGQLYDNVLHRPGDPSGIAYHLKNLANGVGRNDVLMQFGESPENRAAVDSIFGKGAPYTPKET